MITTALICSYFPERLCPSDWQSRFTRLGSRTFHLSITNFVELQKVVSQTDQSPLAAHLLQSS